MAQNDVAASQKLEKLRSAMKEAGVAAYLVPTSDPHLMGMPPARFQRRTYISEFTGSSGTAVVTESAAALWTDGRYFLQAEKELSKDWTLMRMGTPDCPQVYKWLAATLKDGAHVGFDPFLHAEDEVQLLSKKLKEKGIDLVEVNANLVDEIRGEDIPEMPANPIVIQPLELAGESIDSKLKRIREAMKGVEASTLLVPKLDEIAWTLNLRGADDESSPIFISYLIITLESAELYTDAAKVTEDIEAYLKAANVTVKPYGEAVEGLKQRLRENKTSKVWLDPNLVNRALFLAAHEALGPQGGELIVSAGTPLTSFMSIKNEQELNGMRDAHVRDAIALIEFLSWLEKEIATGRVVTEVEIDIELTARRAKQKGFKGRSFPTIAGANENGAIIHYHADPESCGTVDANTMLLIDSGGQYDSGTTDITRTFHLGTPTDYQKTCFTRVLQGHIAMATAVFPQDTPGIAIDAFARRPLWSMGLEYRHGTGHGVGAHLCVHEGPIAVSFRHTSQMAQAPLKANMVISNEPGYYENGQFGIRIENLCIIKHKETPYSFEGLSFLGLETISFVPIQKKLMKTEDLSKQEKAWVDDYHQQVWETVSDKVSPEAKSWLKENTAPLA